MADDPRQTYTPPEGQGPKRYYGAGTSRGYTRDITPKQREQIKNQVDTAGKSWNESRYGKPTTNWVTPEESSKPRYYQPAKHAEPFNVAKDSGGRKGGSGYAPGKFGNVIRNAPSSSGGGSTMSPMRRGLDSVANKYGARKAK
jgi:hypothetical protein